MDHDSSEIISLESLKLSSSPYSSSPPMSLNWS